MLRATLRGLLAHRSRLLRTALAVALGVAFVAGTFVLTDTIDEAFTKAMRANNSDYDVLVRPHAAFTGNNPYTNPRDPLPASVLATVKQVPGVARAEGSVEGYAQVVDKQGKAVQPMGPPTLGLSWSVSYSSRLIEGRAPRDTNEVVLDRLTADKGGYKVGERVLILSTGPAQQYLLVGLVSSKTTLGATLAFFETSTAQAVLGREGHFDGIQVVAAKGTSAETLRDRVTAALPDTAEAITMESAQDEAAKAWTSALGYLNTALLVFAGIALLVGGFIILNTFSILVAQRTRELGLLRALGASREQVLASVMGEAVAVGLFGSLIGIGLGFGLALGLLSLMRGLGWDMPSTSPVFALRTGVVALTAGLTLTLLSSIVPARAAGKVAPMRALNAPETEGSLPLRRRSVLGAATLTTGAALLLAGLFTEAVPRLPSIGLGAVLVFVGIAALTPLVAGPFAKAMSGPLTRLRGEPARLAGQNAVRNPRRTALTASALMIGLGLVGVVTIFAASMKASANKAIDKMMRADYIVSAKGFAGFSSFTPDVARRLQDEPAIGTVAEVRDGEWGLNGVAKTLIGVDPKLVSQFLNLPAASQAAMDKLTTGAVTVRDTIAEKHGWKVGDRIPMTFARTGTVELPIASLLSGTESLGNIDYLVTLDTYDANFAQHLDAQLYVKRAEGSSAADAQAAIDRALKDFPNVEAVDQAGLKKRAAGQVNQLLAIVSALLMFSVLIAVLGIANTLSLSILERRRELGLLRAVGMSKRQVRSMIRWEAVITAVLGAALGMLVAVLFGWALTRALSDQGVDVLVFPIGTLATYVVAAATTGVWAARSPARRAAKLDVLSAIASE